MRPTLFTAIFAISSIAAPITKDQYSDKHVSLDQIENMEARNAEPYVRGHHGNKRGVAAPEDRLYHNIDSPAEDAEVKSEFKRRFSRGQQKRNVDSEEDDHELDARAMRNVQRPGTKTRRSDDENDVEARFNRNPGRPGTKRSDDEGDLEAAATRTFQRFDEADIKVETRAVRPNFSGSSTGHPGGKRSDDTIGVEFRAIRNVQRPGAKPRRSDSEDNAEVDSEDTAEELAEVEARGLGVGTCEKRSADPVFRCNG